MSTFVSSNPYMAMWDRVVNKYSKEYGPYFESFKAKTRLNEVIMIGRAGEGVWLAGELLAAAAIESGKYGKVIFAMPGERRNTPARSYVRFSDHPVRFPASWIHNADDILIFEEEMLTFSSPVLDLDIPTITCRMNPNGFCIVNSSKAPGELGGDVAGKLVTVDGTKISGKILKNPFFMNMAVMGAYLAAKKSDLVNAMESTIKNFVNPRGHKIFGEELGDLNIKAFRVGYESAKF